MTGDDILKDLGIPFDELDSPGHEGERAQYFKWLNVLSTKEVSPEDIKSYIVSMRHAIEMELTKGDDSLSWVSIISGFIPFFGLIRKWYQDMKQLELKARLRNYILLETFLNSPEKARRALERNIKGGVIKK